METAPGRRKSLPAARRHPMRIKRRSWRTFYSAESLPRFIEERDITHCLRPRSWFNTHRSTISPYELSFHIFWKVFGRTMDKDEIVKVSFSMRVWNFRTLFVEKKIVCMIKKRNIYKISICVTCVEGLVTISLNILIEQANFQKWAFLHRGIHPRHTHDHLEEKNKN